MKPRCDICGEIFPSKFLMKFFDIFLICEFCQIELFKLIKEKRQYFMGMIDKKGKKEMAKKRLVRKKLETISLYDLEAGLDFIIQKFTNLLNEYAGIYTDLVLEIDYYHDYDEDRREYVLYGNRLETDEELEDRLFNRRKEIERKAREKEESKENRKKMYERLKKEFEK